MDDLAIEFLKRIQIGLADDELIEVDRSNKENPGCCATHDYLDANMVMLDAFEEVTGFEVDFEKEEDIHAINSAWDQAIKHGFANKI